MNYKCELRCKVRLSNGDDCVILNEEFQLPFVPVERMTLSWEGGGDEWGWSWPFSITNVEWIVTDSRFQLDCETALIDDGEDDEQSIRKSIDVLSPLGFTLLLCEYNKHRRSSSVAH